MVAGAGGWCWLESVASAGVGGILRVIDALTFRVQVVRFIVLSAFRVKQIRLVDLKHHVEKVLQIFNGVFNGFFSCR
ncbi:hypothetical protein [Bartonella rattaustraliani]|uniref:hypothetical protein n=1 Tax=Bartonella rattaustraliani TaxID=481139 RepID=UPI0012E9EC02|nr:hypothetical protein [Bartonella rattaustraliani]